MHWKCTFVKYTCTGSCSLPSTSDPVSLPGTKDPVANLIWHGFKIVGDNLDKNFRPSFQHVGNSTTSMQVSTCMLSKIGLTFLHTQIIPQITLRSMSRNYWSVRMMWHVWWMMLWLWYPGKLDVQNVTCYLLMESRILVQCMDKFSSQRRDVKYHFDFKFSKEMSTKSVIVS